MMVDMDMDKTLFSDRYKEVHGVRPRWMVIETRDDLDRAWKSLEDDIRHQRRVEEAEDKWLDSPIDGVTFEGVPLTRRAFA